MGSESDGIDECSAITCCDAIWGPVDLIERECVPLNAAVQMSAALSAIPAGSRSDSIPIVFYLSVSTKTIQTSNAMSKYFD